MLPEPLLTAALRRLARRRPEVFARLEPFRDAVFLIAPDGAPVCFRLAPRGVEGWVGVAPAGSSMACDVRISGSVRMLLSLFDGSMDADAAFFARRIRVEGDVQAAMALHNALEAAELDLADMAGAGAPLVRRAAASWSRWRGARP